MSITPAASTVVPGGSVEFTPEYTWESGAPESETFISYAVTKDGEAVTEGVTINGNTITFPSVEGEYTVTATSMNLLTAKATVTVEKPTYTVAFDPTAITDMTTTSADQTVTVKIMDGETEVDDATWEYALTTGDDNTAVTTGITQDETTKVLTLSGLAAGSYKLTITTPEDAEYLFNTEDDANVLAFTVTQTSYTVEFTSTDATVSGTTATVKGAEASISVAFKDGETAVEPAPEATASLKKGDADATPVTISEGTISLTELEANTTYTLIISAPENAPYELTGNELTITVKAADAPEYTASLTGTGIDEGKATVEAGNNVTATVALTDAESQAVTTVTAADLTATVTPADKGVTAAITDADGTLTLTVTTTAETEAGEYTIAVAPAETAAFTIAENALTVTVTAAPEPLAMTIASPTETVTIAADADPRSFDFTLNFTGGDAPATVEATELTVGTKTGDSFSALTDWTIAPGQDGAFTVTVPALAAEATEDVTTTLFVQYTKDETTLVSTNSITVVEKATESGDEPAPSTLTITKIAAPEEAISVEAEAEGKAVFTVTTTGEGTLAESALTITATGVEKGSISIEKAAAAEPETPAEGSQEADSTASEDGEEPEAPANTDWTITVNFTAPATAGSATIVLADAAEESTVESATASITITEKTTPDVPELPVEEPTFDEDDTTAPEVKIDGTEMTINFNASPAGEKGEPAEAVMTVALPAAEGADLDQLEAVVEGNAEVTISETGININASKAEIGETIHIIIRKKQAEAPETQSLALLAEGEEEETPEVPTDDDIVMTIDVTIYGVEFTTAPATATLGADGSVEVTFATNDATPDDATVEITAAPAEGDALTAVDGKITFTEAGTYTVTAKAGDNYVATTKIIVKNAPTVTGIEAVNADAAAGNAAIYDLQGRRLTRVNAAGIYIVNGVKTLVR